jgi:pyruvate kinase
MKMKNRGYYRRHTKIVCTLGPASGSPEGIQRLIRAGMDVARLNLSHGSLEEHRSYIETVRQLSQRLGMQVAVLIDLPGPKYRIGKLKGGRTRLTKGNQIRLVTGNITGDSRTIPVTLPELSHNIKSGDTVLLDDGAMQLRVLEIDGEAIICRVSVGGTLREGKGLVVPGRRTSVPYLTEQLRKDIQFAIEQRPDYIALSFVTGTQDVTDVRNILKQSNADIPIITKIERGEAVANFNAILETSDSIMVARGDLGVEIPLERVPLVQKDIIRKCNITGKPVITATEMLESMIKSPRPTRAETTDVANAIFDGSDAIMLSAETSIGKYPEPAVRMMAKIARAAEKHLDYAYILAERRNWMEPKTDELISFSVCQIAHSLRAAAIVAYTQSGSTAKRVSKYRPAVTVLALTPSTAVAGQLLLYWGVRPVLITEPDSVDTTFALAARTARDLGVARTGELIIIAAGIPIGVAGSTNMLKVEKIQ